MLSRGLTALGSNVIERLIDDAARELGFDPVELRTKNMIPASVMPYKTALNLNYDCGDFPANQQKALAEADWDGFPARRDEAKARGWIASYSGVPRDYGRER